MNKKLTNVLCATALMAGIIGISSQPVFAAVDETQSGTTGSYSTDININAGSSTFSVTIPKSMSGSEKAGTLDYNVTVNGDITGSEKIVVTPDETVALSQSGKDNITATIAQTKTEFTGNELLLATDNTITTSGTVTYSGLSAGTWTGTFNFDIKLIDTEAEMITATVSLDGWGDDIVINKA